MTDQFHELARTQLLAEEEARFKLRIEERAQALRGEHRRNVEGSMTFPTDPQEMLTALQQKELLQSHLTSKRFKSAEDDATSDRLRQQINELRRRCQQAGVIEPPPSRMWDKPSPAVANDGVTGE
jgi:preprotein translocase subunit SecD